MRGDGGMSEPAITRLQHARRALALLFLRRELSLHGHCARVQGAGSLDAHQWHIRQERVGSC